jgi:hypothetical protein
MKCQACQRDYDDKAAFCPFCGARPAARRPTLVTGGSAKPALKPAPQQPGALIESYDRTVALNVADLDLAGLGDESPAAPPEPVRAFRADPEVERTVAITLPPILAEAPARPAGRPVKATVMGMPAVKRAATPAGAAMQAGMAPTPKSPVPTPVAATPLAEKTVAMDLGQARVESVRPAPAPAEKTVAMAAPAVHGIDAMARTMPASAELAQQLKVELAAQKTAVTPAQVPPKRGGGLKWLFIALGTLVVAAIVLTVFWVVLKKGGASGAVASIARGGDAVLSVDLDAARGSWLYEKLEPMIKQGLAEEKLGKLMTLAGVELTQLHAAAVGIDYDDQGNNQVALLADFDLEKADAALKETLAKDKEDRVHELGGTKFYGKADRMLAGIVDGLLLGGSKTNVELMLEIRSGEVSTAISKDEYAMVLEHLDQGATAWFVGGANPALVEENKEVPGIGEHLAKLKTMGGSLDLSGDLALVLVLELDEEAATKLAETATEHLDKKDEYLKELPPDFQEDAKTILETVSVEAKGPVLVVKLTVPRAVAEPYATPEQIQKLGQVF